MQISRILTAHKKIIQIQYVIFQAMSPPFSTKFLTETLYAFEKKSPSMYNSSDFECSDESSPNFSCHFWNEVVRVYSNSVSWKDNSFAFF